MTRDSFMEIPPDTYLIWPPRNFSILMSICPSAAVSVSVLTPVVYPAVYPGAFFPIQLGRKISINHCAAVAKAICRRPLSALPPKADMCGARAYVCYGPKADIRTIQSPRWRAGAATAAQ
jgi:hypothetical protein